MLTRNHLHMLKSEMDRCEQSGDPNEQRRAAQFGPLVDFANWAYDAIIALASGAGDTVKPLPSGDEATDPANFAGGTDGNPGAAVVSSGRKSRGKR